MTTTKPAVTPEVARRLLEHERFRWRAGMKVENGYRVTRAYEGGRLAVSNERGSSFEQPSPMAAYQAGALWYPDLTDTATAGVLLAMLPTSPRRAPAAIGDSWLSVDIHTSRGHWEVSVSRYSVVPFPGQPFAVEQSTVCNTADEHLGVAVARALLAVWEAV